MKNLLPNMLWALALLLPYFAKGQIGSTIPSGYRADWTDVGYPGSIPSTYDVDIDAVDDLGMDNQGIKIKEDDNFTYLDAAIENADPTKLTRIFFPPGTYYIKGQLSFLRNFQGRNNSNIVLQGSGSDYTHLIFTHEDSNCIWIEGYDDLYSSTLLDQTASARTSSLDMSKTYGSVDDYIEIQSPLDDTYHDRLCGGTDNSQAWWHSRYKGQLTQIADIDQQDPENITITDVWSIDYPVAVSSCVEDPIHSGCSTRVVQVHPVENIGIEDMSIEDDALDAFTANKNIVHFKLSANCWVSGVEFINSEQDNINVIRSYKVEIRDSYFHHNDDTESHYGVWLKQSATKCLVENNIFDHLRHAISMGRGASQNVAGYNHSIDPVNGQADYIFHGWYPSANNYEGNSSKYLEWEAYWGPAGLYNVAFRNKCQGSPRTNNELTILVDDYSSVLGNTSISGINYTDAHETCVTSPTVPTHRIEDCNDTYDPCSTLSDISYYHTSRPSFLDQELSWPPIGPPTNGTQTISQYNAANKRWIKGAQYTINPRNSDVGFSQENRGLITSMNTATKDNQNIIRNRGERSLGLREYSTTVSNRKVGPVTAATLGTVGQEEIFYALNDYSGSQPSNAMLLMSTGKDLTTTTLFLNIPNAEVTAITKGDFNNDGDDEIVFAVMRNGLPEVYKTDDAAADPTSPESEYELIHGSSVVYWRVTALTAADFDGDGEDELVLGKNASMDGNTQVRLYTSDFTSDHAIYQALNSNEEVVALASGDFGNGQDELINGFMENGEPHLYRSATASSKGSQFWNPSSWWTLIAMTAGDLDEDGDDELITGYLSDYNDLLIKKNDEAGSIDIDIFRPEQPYWYLSGLAIEEDKPSYGSKMKSPINSSSVGQEPYSALALQLYPNPSSGVFQLEANREIREILVMDLYGRIVLRSQGGKDPITKIDLSHLADGVYILKASDTQGQSVSNRIIKQ